MSNAIVSALEVQLDVSEATMNVTDLSRALESLKRVSTNVGTAISKAFVPVLNSLTSIHTEIKAVNTSVSQTADEMDSLKASSKISFNLSGLFEGISDGYDGLKTFVDELASVDKYSEKFDKLFKNVTKANNVSTLLENVLPNSAQLSETVTKWTNENLIGKISSVLEKNGGPISTAATNMLSSITGAFQKVGGALGGMSLGWGAAIAGIVTLIVLLVQNWDAVKSAILAGWEAIKQGIGMVAEWFNSNIIQPVIGFFSSAIEGISTKLQEGIAFVQSIFNGISDFLQGAFATDWTEQFGVFGNVLNAFFANVENVWNAVKSIFGGIVDFVKNIFAGNWGAAWDSIVGIFKGVWDLLVSIVKAPINGIIGLINGLVQGIVDGINMVIRALNSISFDVPDWVPIIGGQTFGFNLKLLSAPQIPYLAKGAVLPANRPFLAVVGDQRHGTNVEAPLATIQEAVALVLEDHIGAMMAGFQALLKEQQATRRTIEGIEIGDAVIGRAAERYGRKMAVVRGGY